MVGQLFMAKVARKPIPATLEPNCNYVSSAVVVVASSLSIYASSMDSNISKPNLILWGCCFLIYHSLARILAIDLKPTAI